MTAFSSSRCEDFMARYAAVTSKKLSRSEIERMIEDMERDRLARQDPTRR